jgi:hypothetical protein
MTAAHIAPTPSSAILSPMNLISSFDMTALRQRRELTCVAHVQANFLVARAVPIESIELFKDSH